MKTEWWVTIRSPSVRFFTMMHLNGWQKGLQDIPFRFF